MCVLVSDPLTTKSACLEWNKSQQSRVGFLLGSGAELASWEMSQVPEPAQRGGEGCMGTPEGEEGEATAACL